MNRNPGLEPGTYYLKGNHSKPTELISVITYLVPLLMGAEGGFAPPSSGL